ncbi:hypothetical protein [Sphingomonas morindae]|uniref:Uncharacterized protein n=1 Tax=Sphingomonas morindae TaxID=1541170 RepID=A0ABY4X7T3_9SPHN|nr:hypothetical protein [Sphingomonas morindae]USI72998.1 hypothetical protein LHA26_00525 [Sphingomonas morindae]
MWLYNGVDPVMPMCEKRIHGANASAAVNLIAGFIQMDGGTPAFPDEGDKQAQQDDVELHAIIKGASYRLHVSLGQRKGKAAHFPVPARHENVIVLGVVRDGFSTQVVEITADMIEEHGTKHGGSIDVALTKLEPIDSFDRRL